MGDACGVARMLKEEGIDAPEKEAFHRALARAIKGRVRIPVVLVGCLCTPGALEAILNAGEADFFSMARALIREPGLVKR